MVEQPSWDADAVAWRRFAGGLRERMGEANRRAAEAEGKLQGVWDRSERWRDQFHSVLSAKRRDGRMLDQLEALLDEGDLPGARDLLAERRTAIDAARGSATAE